MLPVTAGFIEFVRATTGAACFTDFCLANAATAFKEAAGFALDNVSFSRFSLAIFIPIAIPASMASCVLITAITFLLRTSSFPTPLEAGRLTISAGLPVAELTTAARAALGFVLITATLVKLRSLWIWGIAELTFLDGSGATRFPLTSFTMRSF